MRQPNVTKRSFYNEQFGSVSFPIENSRFIFILVPLISEIFFRCLLLVVFFFFARASSVFL